MLLDTVDCMVRSLAWRAELKRHRWADAYLPGDAFAAFMKSKRVRLAGALRTVRLLR